MTNGVAVMASAYLVRSAVMATLIATISLMSQTVHLVHYQKAGSTVAITRAASSQINDAMASLIVGMVPMKRAACKLIHPLRKAVITTRSSPVHQLAALTN